MSLILKCLEPLTAIGCGLAAASVSMLDGGLAAGAVIGGAGLIARFREQSIKHGLDEASLINRMQAAVIRQWDTIHLTQEDRDTIALADSAMTRHLEACMLSREDLAASSLATEPFPTRAARLIVDRLALHDPIFAADGVAESLTRRFARTVITDAINAAKNDPAYAALLTLDLVIAGNVGHAVTHDMLGEQTALIRQLIAAAQGQATERNVTDAALLELARRIADKVEDPQQALAELSRALDELVRLREAAARGSNFGDLIDEALRRAAAHNEVGAFDKGEDELARALAQLEEEDAARKAAKLSLIERGIEQARLAFDADAMAGWVMRRLETEAGTLGFDALRNEQHRWYEQGRVRGLPLEMELSIRLARHAEAHAETSEQRAMAQNNLGATLQTQGARTGGEAGLTLLADAVSAFRAALSVYTQSAMPADWAATQNNLGNALQTQGERTGGEAGLKLLADAVSAYRDALSVRTQSAMPADWAMTQNNLGAALQTQGERTGGEAGLKLLTDAVSAYRDALSVYTQSAMPADWAMTQNNLGIALATQGARTGGEAGLALLADAVSAFRAALSVWTAEHFSYQHELASRNLARTEALIAARMDGE